MFRPVPKRIQRPYIYVGHKINLQTYAKVVLLGWGGRGEKSVVPSLDSFASV